MCRIASIFLLQKLKGSMSRDERDFNNFETRAVIKYFFHARQGAEGNSSQSDIRGICSIACDRQKLIGPLKRRWIFARDARRPGQPKTLSAQVIIDQIHELILEDRRIWSKSVSEQLGISRERVGSNIREDLDMRNLSAKWVPKCLYADQKRQ